MQPHCLFVITCEQTPGFSYVLLLQWITHQMVQIKKNFIWRAAHEFSSSLQSLAFHHLYYSLRVFFVTNSFCIPPNPKTALRTATFTCRLWAPLQIPWHSHCFLLLHKEILWEVNAGLSVWCQKGNLRSLVEQMWFFFSLNSAVIKINITGSY